MTPDVRESPSNELGLSLAKLPRIFDIAHVSSSIAEDFPIWFGLGLPKGIRFTGNSSEPARGYVSHGGRVRSLNLESYDIWFRFLVPRTLSAMRSMSLDDRTPVITALRGAELIMEVSDLMSAKKLFSRIRVIPRAIMTGNDPLSDREFSILAPGGSSTAVVSGIDWSIWSRFDASRSLVSACDSVAKEYNTDSEVVFARGLALVSLMCLTGLSSLDMCCGDSGLGE